MKSHRVFIIDTYYDAFLKDHYRGSARSNTYETMRTALLERLFGTANFYSQAFKSLGHEAEEFIVNDEVLQKQWGKEHGIKLRFKHKIFSLIPLIRRLQRESWFYGVLEAEIKEFNPDILFIQNIGAIKPSFLKMIKTKYSVKVVGQIAARMPDRTHFIPYDMIFSSLPHYVETFRDLGIKSHLLLLAFSPVVLNKVKDGAKYNVTHIGGYGPIHNERNKVLEQVAFKIPIDFWGYGTSNLSTESPILKRFHGVAWGTDMYSILKRSKITLTKHIESVAGKYANNMTLYEATGCGCLLMVDQKDNLGDIFIPDKEVVTYRNTEDLIDKIHYYLEHEDERAVIAKNGQERTLRDHTYYARAKEMIEILDKELF